MKRVLLTGISGVGKSSVISALAARGYTAVDTDCDAFSQWVPVKDDSAVAGTPVESARDWVWREDRIEALLSTNQGDVLFVSGCAPNMSRFLPRFDHVILLSAPPEVLVDRLATRTTNTYGKHPDEVARVLDLRETVEPLLRRAAGHAIDTHASLDAVVNAVVRIAFPTPGDRHTQ